MKPPSSRYAPHIAVLCLIAAVPTLLHSYGRLDVEDCANVAVLLPATNGATAPDLDFHEKWLERVKANGDWHAARIPIEDTRHDLKTLIVRSYDPKLLYHKPTQPLVRGFEPERLSVDWVEHEGEEIPIHRAHYDEDRFEIIAAYMLIYNGEPVSNPYLAQLLAAPIQLVRGRGPMTMLWVSATIGPRKKDAVERLALDWLTASWDRYQAVCQPG